MRWVVRPGRKNGGTVVVFTSPRAAVVRVTVVRVFPACRVMGSFRVRVRAGLNRIPFRGRLRGRVLPAGTYRLRLREVRAQEDAAAVTIVVARGKTTAKRLRAARRAAACGSDEALGSVLPLGSSLPPTPGTPSGKSGETHPSVPLAEAAKAIVRQAKALTSGVKRTVQDSGPTSPLFLTLVGLLTLASVALGAFVFLKIMQLAEIRDRLYR